MDRNNKDECPYCSPCSSCVCTINESRPLFRSKARQGLVTYLNGVQWCPLFSLSLRARTGDSLRVSVSPAPNGSPSAPPHQAPPKSHQLHDHRNQTRGSL